MRRLLTGQSLRRGLLLGLDGLALWILAVILASYTSQPTVGSLEGSPVRFTVDIMQSWLQTPAMEPLEIMAYAGLSIAVLGPAGYWALRPLKAWLAGGSDERAEETSSGEFHFSHDRSVGTMGADGGDVDSITSEFENVAGDRSSRQSDWTALVFETDDSPVGLPQQVAVPEGDFLRSSSGSADREDESTDDDDPIERPNVTARYSQIENDLDASRRSESTAVVSNGGASHERVGEEPPSADLPHESPAPTEDSQTDLSDEADDRLSDHDDEQEDDESSPQSTPSDDPAEEVAAAVSSARKKLSTTASHIEKAADGPSVQSARASLAEIRGDSEASVESLSSKLPEEHGSIAVNVKDARSDQTRIVTGFDDLRVD